MTKLGERVVATHFRNRHRSQFDRMFARGAIRDLKLWRELHGLRPQKKVRP